MPMTMRNNHASASYPEGTPPDREPAIRRPGLAARNRLGRVPPPLTAAFRAGMGRSGPPGSPAVPDQPRGDLAGPWATSTHGADPEGRAASGAGVSAALLAHAVVHPITAGDSPPLTSRRHRLPWRETVSKEVPPSMNSEGEE